MTLYATPNLVQRIEQFVDEILRSTPGAAEICYAVSITVMPGAAPASFEPVLYIVLTGPGGVEDHRHAANLMVFDLHPTREEVADMVADGLRTINQTEASLTQENPITVNLVNPEHN